MLAVSAVLASACLGEDQPDPGLALHANVLQLNAAGKYTESIPLAERLIADLRVRFGERNAAVGIVLITLADTCRFAGQPDRAETSYKQALDILEATFGKEHAQYALALNNLGVLYGTAARNAEASKAFEEALEIRKRVLGVHSPQYGMTAGNLAETYRALRQFHKAEPLFKLAAEVLETALGEANPTHLTVLDQWANLHIDQGHYGQAEPLRQRAMGIRRRALGEQHPAYATSLGSLATLYASMAEYGKAEPLLRQALEIRRKALGEQHPDYAVSLSSLALLYGLMGQYAKAEPLHRQAMEIQRNVLGEEHPDYATSLSALASLYSSMGQYDKAEPLCRQALDILSKVVGDNQLAYVISLHNLASLCRSMGQYDEAERLCRRALQIRENVLGKEHPDYAASLNDLGLLYSELGRYEEAQLLYRQAMEIRRKALGEQHPYYALSLDNLASLCKSVGRYEEAERLCRRALEIWRKALGEAHPSYATSLNNLASLYQDIGRCEKAEPLYRKAMEILGKVDGEDHPHYASSLNNLAALYHDMGRCEEAEPVYRQALDIQRKVLGENHPAYAGCLNNLACLYHDTGRYEKAEPLYRQAMEIRRKVLGEQHPDYAASLNNLAALYRDTGQYEKAEPLCRQAMPVQLGALRRVFSFSSERDMRAYLALTRNTVGFLVSLSARNATRDAVCVSETLDWVLRTKGIVTETCCRFRGAQNHDPAVADRVAAMRSLRQRLSNLTFTPVASAGGNADAQQRETLRQQVEQVEADLNRRLSDRLPSQSAANTDTATVQRCLHVGQTLIEFVHTYVRVPVPPGERPHPCAPRYFAFVLSDSPGEMPRLLDLGDGGEIDESVKRVRESMQGFRRDSFGDEKSREEDFRAASRELYEKVFAPLRAAVGSATTVYLAPDGELNRVPFEALVDREGKYLIETYRFAYLSSGRDLLRQPAAHAQGTVVFAAPDYDLGSKERESGAKLVLAALSPPTAAAFTGTRSTDVRGLEWEPLTGAQSEARDIERELAGTQYAPVRSFTGTAAIEEAFKAIRAPRLLHVSTHGFFLPDQRLPPEELLGPMPLQAGFGAARGLAQLRGVENPMLRSGLVLAGANKLGEAAPDDSAIDDGWLTAEEIAMMDLTGTDLVVLSACESGLGDVPYGEGVSGLRRAFLYAGARTLVTSLFKVPDKETSELMSNFYGGLKAGKSKLDALRDAQLAMIQRRREAHGTAHPFYWGSFVLVGESG